jgi:malonyl-CoA O-methyltransferase
MADSVTAAGRPLDPAAVAAVLRRLARLPAAPWLHTEVARRMAQRLAVIRLQPERVLDWWGFLGASGSVLEAAYPKAQRIVVEPDVAFVARSRAARTRPWWSLRRRPDGDDVVFEADAGRAGTAQLVWANMMLPAVADPPALFARWHELLRADGFVMFSCLGPGSLAELRALYASHGWGPPAADFVDMHDLGDMLVHAGFADPVMDQETLHLHWESPAALLAELRTLGGNAHPRRHPAPRGRAWRAALERALESLRDADGRIGLSFEVAYGHAFRGAPRLRADAPTTVSLEDMRALVRTRPPRPVAGGAPRSVR